MTSGPRVTLNLRDALAGILCVPFNTHTSMGDVEHLLGRPDDVGGFTRKRRRGSILKYGNVEFHFPRGKLSLIFMERFEVPYGSGGVAVDPWIVRGGLSSDEAEAYLLREGLPYVKTARMDGLVLELHAGASVLHFEESGGLHLLEAVSIRLAASPS